MINAEIPEVRNLPDSVINGVGEGVQVFIHDTDKEFGPVRRSSHEMVNDVVDEMFAREGVTRNPELRVLCVLAARIAVAKLASSPGFTVEFGDWMKNDPHLVVDVNLRPEQPLQFLGHVSASGEVKSDKD